MDPTLAVIIVTSFLVPYLKSAGESTGKITPDVASNVWKSITNLFKSKNDKEQLKDFEKYPEQLKENMTQWLEAKLAENEDFAQELYHMIKPFLEEGQSNGVQIKNAKKVGIINLHGANLSGATGNKFIGAVFNNPDSKTDGE